MQGAIMKAQLRSTALAVCLLGPAAVTMSALPTVAMAQATPEVQSLDVRADGPLQPGGRLRLRMEGTPHARAMVRIRGVRDSIALREVERGVYVGRYVITRADNIEPGAPIRAILRSGNRTAVAEYNVPDNVAAAQPAPQELRIARFVAQPVDSAEPGTVLRFTVEGNPGATMAYVDLPGIDRNVRLSEARPGVYEGAYTLRRDDRLRINAPVVANLRWGDRIATTNLDHPLVAAIVPENVPIEVVSHPNNGTIDGDVARVRGRTAPFASVHVRVQASPPVIGQFGVAQQVFNDTLQADARGFFEFSFRSPFPVPGTKYDVEMVARKADVTREARLTLFQRQG
jgi:hypothetical protein